MSVTELPEDVLEYIDIRDQVPKLGTSRLPDLETVRDALRSRGAPDLTRLDHLFAGKEETGGDEEMLG